MFVENAALFQLHAISLRSYAPKAIDRMQLLAAITTTSVCLSGHFRVCGLLP